MFIHYADENENENERERKKTAKLFPNSINTFNLNLLTLKLENCPKSFSSFYYHLYLIQIARASLFVYCNKIKIKKK